MNNKMVIRNLIPNNITVTEQFRIRDQFMGMVNKWQFQSRPEMREFVEELEEASGVRCCLAPGPGRLAGFKLVNEQAYMWFILKWA